MNLNRINYNDLNSRQKESYNFHKIASLLADYGFYSMWLNDDWEGADFITVHNDGVQMLRVQLKGRITIDKKYLGKEIYIVFSNKQGEWYLYPHDEIFKVITGHSEGARKHGARSFSYIPKWIEPTMNEYKIN